MSKKKKEVSPEEAHKKLVKSFIIQTLRRASYRFRTRGQAIKNARVGRGLYKCNRCGEIVKNKQFKVDHIECVVDPEKGFTTWDEYIERMFCTADQYQILCSSCHDTKTCLEQSLRKAFRDAKKVVKPKKLKKK